MKSLYKKVTTWYFSKNALPYWSVLIVDSVFIVLSGVLSHCLHTGTLNTMMLFWSVTGTWCCYLLFYMLGFRIMHSYSGVIRYSSFIDLWRMLVANMIGVAIIFVIRHTTPIDKILVPIAWEELTVAFILGTAMMWTMRILVKYLYDIYFVSASAQKVFIYGVKEGGIALAKSIHSQQSQYVVTGFVSDNPHDWQHLLMGAKIYPNNNLVAKMRQKGATVLMVSPYMTDCIRNNQQMTDSLAEAGIKILMYTHHEWDGKSDLLHTQLKEVEIEDLLPRQQIDVDIDGISKILSGKRVMITGAAGSIGSEITRQVALFKPSQLVLIDQAETPLHDIRLMMASKFADIPCETITVSICQEFHMESIFAEYKPEYVFHAAAYKHVPMMEYNPAEAVMNNINGTRIIADLAVKYGTKKFVMVSTDKAVNPTNVMGCSKRICEMYCQSLGKHVEATLVSANSTSAATQFVTTRFGNVLGSNGSVIPLFKEQIKNGGPLTVTHPDIIRYFMLISEACKLVLQAGAMGNGGEIYVFDMGNPVKIADLAKRMILLSGAKNVKIEYTGLRDGEKLYEELLNQEESTKPSSHPKIRLAKVRELDYKEVCEGIEQLVNATIARADKMTIVKQMKVLVPEFKSMHSKYEVLD